MHMGRFSSAIARGFKLPRTRFCKTLLIVVALSAPLTGRADLLQTAIHSPDGRNSIVLDAANGDGDCVRYTIRREDHPLMGPSPLGPMLVVGGMLGKGA